MRVGAAAPTSPITLAASLPAPAAAEIPESFENTLPPKFLSGLQVRMAACLAATCLGGSCSLGWLCMSCGATDRHIDSQWSLELGGKRWSLELGRKRWSLEVAARCTVDTTS